MAPLLTAFLDSPSSVKLSAAMAIGSVAVVRHAWLDAKTGIIPHGETVPVLAALLVVLPIWLDRPLWVTFAGAGAAFAVFGVVHWVRPPALGGGDVMLAAVAGALTGYPQIAVAVAAAGLLSLAPAVWMAVRTDRDSRPALVFGPYIACGTLAATWVPLAAWRFSA